MSQTLTTSSASFNDDNSFAHVCMIAALASLARAAADFVRISNDPNQSSLRSFPGFVSEKCPTLDEEFIFANGNSTKGI